MAEFEEHLLEFERLLQAEVTCTVFRYVPNPFPPHQRAKLLELIANLKEQLRKMRDIFGLTTELVDLRWRLTVTLLHFSTNLEECQSRRIKGFGDLDDETAKRLDSYLQNLIATINSVLQAARNL